MAYRVWARVDGGVTITPRDPTLTDDQWATQLAKLATAEHLVGATTTDVLGAVMFPVPDGLGRRFRNAWRWSGTEVVHDVHACRVIRMREIHRERDYRAEEAHVKAHTEAGVRRAAWQQYQRELVAMDCDISNLTTAAAIAAYEPPWPQEPA